jgi:hypothetical protein
VKGRHPKTFTTCAASALFRRVRSSPYCRRDKRTLALRFCADIFEKLRNLRVSKIEARRAILENYDTMPLSSN